MNWIVLDDFLYPGQSRLRMHAVPEKTGAALMARLLAAAAAAGADLATGAYVTTLMLTHHDRTCAPCPHRHRLNGSNRM